MINGSRIRFPAETILPIQYHIEWILFPPKTAHFVPLNLYCDCPFAFKIKFASVLVCNIRVVTFLADFWQTAMKLANILYYIWNFGHHFIIRIVCLNPRHWINNTCPLDMSSFSIQLKTQCFVAWISFSILPCTTLSIPSRPCFPVPQLYKQTCIIGTKSCVSISCHALFKSSMYVMRLIDIVKIAYFI